MFPPVDGIYRAGNVFLDGNSNLVLQASQENGQYFSGKLRGNWRGTIGTTWEARIKLDCLFPGLWPSFWTVNEDPQPDGEVDVFEWYGNGAMGSRYDRPRGIQREDLGREIDSRDGGRRLAHLAHALG